MYGKKLSTEQALKYIDAFPIGDGPPSIEKIVAVVEWINRLIDDERQFGTGTQQDQLELFDYLIRISRKKPHAGTDILAKMMLTKWAEKSQNLYAKAYHLGHDDGNINGSFHATKRGALKIEKIKKININRAANGRRLIGATSREKVRTAAQKFKHLSKESAAPNIADSVGLSAGTVRRYLSELFPGDKWTNKL
jgi:hypothetical protein